MVLLKQEKGKKRKKKGCYCVKGVAKTEKIKKNDNSSNGFAEIGERKEKKKDCNCGNSVAKIEKIKKKKKRR